MKKLLFLVCGSLWLTVANAQLSCEELAELTVSIEDLSEVLQTVEEFGVDSELDQSLGDLAHALTDVAKVEQDVKLTRWIEDLKNSWKNMDRTLFETSLDNVFGRLDELGYRDCND